MSLRRVASWLLAAGVALALLLAATWTAWWLHAHSLVRTVQAEITADRLPSNAEEILPAAVPEADNAAPLLERARVLLDGINKREGYIDACPGVSSPERAPELFDAQRLAALRAQMALPDVRETLTLLREASRRPVAVFDRNYRLGPAMDIGTLTSLLQGAHLLGTAAWLSAKDGDASAATSDLAAVSRLAAFGLSDPVFIGWLVGMSLDKLAVSMTSVALAALPGGSFRAADWKVLNAIWKSHRETARGGSQRAIDGERILMGGWVYDHALRANESLPGLFVAASPAFNESFTKDRSLQLALWAYQYPLRPLLIADYAAYLRFMLGLRRAAEAPSGQDDTVRLAAAIPRTALFTRITAPALQGVLGRTDEYIVLLQLGQIGLALEDYRTRHGSYPATLEETGLQEGMLNDPFSGGSLVYRPSDRGILLYSVGRDRIDDGGANRKDLVWRTEYCSLL